MIGAGGRVTEDGQGSARAAGGSGREAEVDRAAGIGGQHSPAIIGAGKGRRGADAGDRQWRGAVVGEGETAAAAVADGDIAEADAVAAQHHGTRHGNLDLHRRRQIRDRVLRGRGPGEGDGGEGAGDSGCGEHFERATGGIRCESDLQGSGQRRRAAHDNPGVAAGIDRGKYGARSSKLARHGRITGKCAPGTDSDIPYHASIQIQGAPIDSRSP